MRCETYSPGAHGVDAVGLGIAFGEVDMVPERPLDLLMQHTPVGVTHGTSGRQVVCRHLVASSLMPPMPIKKEQKPFQLYM